MLMVPALGSGLGAPAALPFGAGVAPGIAAPPVAAAAVPAQAVSSTTAAIEHIFPAKPRRAYPLLRTPTLSFDRLRS
jgi:hypothetical protein